MSAALVWPGVCYAGQNGSEEGGVYVSQNVSDSVYGRHLCADVVLATATAWDILDHRIRPNFSDASVCDYDYGGSGAADGGALGVESSHPLEVTPDYLTESVAAGARIVGYDADTGVIALAGSSDDDEFEEQGVKHVKVDYYPGNSSFASWLLTLTDGARQEKAILAALIGFDRDYDPLLNQYRIRYSPGSSAIYFAVDNALNNYKPYLANLDTNLAYLSPIVSTNIGLVRTDIAGFWDKCYKYLQGQDDKLTSIHTRLGTLDTHITNVTAAVNRLNSGSLAVWLEHIYGKLDGLEVGGGGLSIDDSLKLTTIKDNVVLGAGATVDNRSHLVKIYNRLWEMYSQIQTNGSALYGLDSAGKRLYYLKEIYEMMAGYEPGDSPVIGGDKAFQTAVLDRLDAIVALLGIDAVANGLAELLDKLVGQLDFPRIGASLGDLTDVAHRVFPFCLIFFVISAMHALNADPVAPSLDLQLPAGLDGVTVPLTLDLADFDGIAVVARALLLAVYLAGLISATRQYVFEKSGG